jgi:uncharacterized membrane protein
MFSKKSNPFPDPVIKNIEAIIGLQFRHEQSIPSHQRSLEKIAASFGKPNFLYLQLLVFIFWGALSHFNPSGLKSWHLPILDLEQDWLDMAALLISTAVLVYQTRDSKMNNERSLLMLQMNLLTEQKLAKVIALIEELRIDLPNVHNRQDLEAELMKQVTDPQVVLDILQEALENSSEEVNSEINEQIDEKIGEKINEKISAQIDEKLVKR